MRHRASKRSRGGPRPQPRVKAHTVKAQTRQELLAHIESAHRSLLLFNRAGSRADRHRHLERAIRELDSAVQMRPGNHILRRQLVLCRLAAGSLATGGEVEPLEIVLRPDSLKTSPPRRL
jgi:hypothetical protein